MANLENRLSNIMVKFFLATHALIKKDNLYLVTKRSEKNDYMPLKWDLPGGTTHFGETCEQALIREVREETDLNIKIDHLLHIYSNPPKEQKQYFQVIYLCHYQNGQVQLDSREHSEYQWLPKEQISKLDTIHFLQDLIASKQYKLL